MTEDEKEVGVHFRCNERGKGDQGAEITQTTLRGRTANIHQFYFCWVLLNIFLDGATVHIRAYKRTLRDRAA